MAAASNEVLRRLVTNEFYQKTLFPDIGTLFNSFQPDEPPSDVARNLGDYVESRAWLSLGARLGYFDELPPDASEQETLRRVGQARVLDDLQWPRWFTDFAMNIVQGHVPLQEQLPPGDPATLAVFQAALIAAEGFREPLLVHLQESLQSRESVLDDFSQPSGPGVFDALRAADAVSTSTPATCVAGFILLLDLLATFDSIFPPYSEHLLSDPAAAGPIARRELARVTGRLLRWRLNLWDERTTRRLRAVIAMFFRVAEQELAGLPEEAGVTWNVGVSRIYFQNILARWRDRGGLEPDTSPREVDLVGRGGGAAATSEAWSISGTITGGSGATVTLSGAASATTTADASGNYSFTGLANGVYTVKPTKTGVTFSPVDQAVTISGANLSSINFTPTTWSISGTITGGSGATVTLSGAAVATTKADASGNYSFTDLANGAYKVKPTKTGVTFSPVDQAVTISGANVTAVNFTANA